MGLTGALRKATKAVVPAVDGAAGTLVRKGTYTEATDTVGSDTTYTGFQVAWDDYPSHLVDGEIVRQGDRKAIIAASAITVTPTPKTDALKVGSETWQIIHVNEIRTGADTIAFELQVRR